MNIYVDTVRGVLEILNEAISHALFETLNIKQDFVKRNNFLLLLSLRVFEFSVLTLTITTIRNTMQHFYFGIRYLNQCCWTNRRKRYARSEIRVAKNKIWIPHKNITPLFRCSKLYVLELFIKLQIYYWTYPKQYGFSFYHVRK